MFADLLTARGGTQRNKGLRLRRRSRQPRQPRQLLVLAALSRPPSKPNYNSFVHVSGEVGNDTS
jgi:hypothetical protein